MQKTRLTITLKEIEDSHAAETGAKALSLAHLKRMGLPVPNGFCITATAYNEHIESTSIANQLKKPKASDLPTIREAIINVTLAEAIEQQITLQYRSLKTQRVAVRSSATAEDLPEHSFAGLYDTYLDVTNLRQCIEAVKKCWASLWTNRAFEYRRRNSFDHASTAMAVIVQTLVHAKAAGVIFTTDPVTASPSRIIVEACSGLGDSLVSGKVTPDRFIVRKRNLKIISHRINENATTACIDKRVVTKLAILAKKIEIEFAGPQDIEWAVDEGEIFLLQTRPITALPPEKSWHEKQVWTNSNTAEVAPDVMTPMTWSIVNRFVKALFTPLTKLISVRMGDHPIFGRVAGRVYFNVNTTLAFAQNIPGAANPETDKLFGGQLDSMFQSGRIDIPDEHLPNLHFSLVKTILKLPLSVITVLSYTPKRTEHFIANISTQTEKLRNMNISSMIAPQLVEAITGSVLDKADFRGFMFIGRGLYAFMLLDGLCKKWFGPEGDTYANRLLTATTGMHSADAGTALWQLALEAKEHKQIRQAIQASQNWNQILQTIAYLEASADFLNSWNRFMAEHGHHCRGEIELFNPRWSETPDYILDIIRTYFTSIDQTDPLQTYESLAQQRDQLTAQCRKRLNPLKRCIFNYLLRYAKKGCVLRENWKSQTIRYMTVLRNMFLELGTKLSDIATLQNPDDIFFLEIEELASVAADAADFDIKETVLQRRAEYERNKTLTPPSVVVGVFDPENYIPDPIDTEAHILHGMAVSSGVVTGKARVILRADTEQQLNAGEILVAPFTDPGWTPYFIPAAGIVMDQGGLLSHGSIIAREYGIPAVVNVGHATKIIKTGQTIRLDANKGTVEIVHE